MTTLFDKVYFHKRFFYDFSQHNQSEIPLEVSRLWETVGTPAMPLIGMALPLLITAWGMKKVINRTLDEVIDDNREPIDQFINRQDPAVQAELREALEWRANTMMLLRLGFQVFYPVIKATLGFSGAKIEIDPAEILPASLVRLAQQIIPDDVALRTEPIPPFRGLPLMLSWTLFLTATGLFAWQTKRHVTNAIDYNNVCQLIHEKMNHVASFSNAMDDIGFVVGGNEVLRSYVADSDLLTNGSQRSSTVLALFRSLLEANTFKGQPSFASFRGRALAAFTVMKQVKDDFTKTLQVAGQLDAYVSIAKFYKQMQAGDNAHVCFVEYEQAATKPHLALTNFWHPFLNPAKVVTNSIEMGGSANAANVILTGPNAAGKSTALKAIIISVLLAQTLGIAPADRMVITPFTAINSYLNIADTEGRESLFQAEMRRAQQLINSIRVLPRGQFSFVIMDEIFTGTNPEEGQAGAYGIAKFLANIDKSMCIIATHFKKLTELEKDTAGRSKNYKVCAIKNMDGSFTYPYKLESGITDQAIALDLLQNEGFDAEIMHSAQQVMQEIQDGKRAQFGAQTATA